MMQSTRAETGPVIVVTGITSSQDACSHELRRRGFVVQHAVTEGIAVPKTSFAVTLSRRLVAKIATEHSLPVLPIKRYTPFKQAYIADRATYIIRRSTSIAASDCWLADDPDDPIIKDSAQSMERQHMLISINSYYGPQIAIYFGFLDFYREKLIAPMIAGAILFSIRLIYGDLDTVGLPIYCIAMSLWSTYFLEFWKRRGAELAYAWGVWGSEDRQFTQELAKKASQEHKKADVRRVLSFFALCSLIALQIMILFGYNYVHDHSAAFFGSGYWWSSYIADWLYVFVSFVFSSLFQPLSKAMNDFELHPTKTQADSFLALQRFAFEFVNKYAALFQAAFVFKDLERVQRLLIIMLVVIASLNNLKEMFGPRIRATILRSMAKSKKKKEGAEAVRQRRASVELDNEEDNLQDDEVKAWDDLVRSELVKPEYSLQGDYLELVIQFGLICMFAVALPIAPTFAYVHNFFESRVDLTKLAGSRRPPINVRSNIGSWQLCFEIIAFISVFTNCFMLTSVSTNIKVIIPSDMHALIDTDYGRLLAMILVEHVLLAFKVAMILLIDDVPVWMQEALARDRIQADMMVLAASAGAPLQETADTNWTELGSVTGSVRSETVPSTTPVHTGTMGMGGGIDPHRSSGRGVNSPVTPLSSSREVSDHGHHTPSHSGREVADLQKTKSYFTGRMAVEENHLMQQAHMNAQHTASSKRGKKREASVAEQSELAISKLLNQTSSVYSFDPMNISWLITVPPLLQHLGFNPFVYIPLAVLYFSYAQTSKDRVDRKSALGIVSDPTLIKLVLNDLPSWVNDSEHQRVEWFNTLVQKLWPQLSLALEGQMISQIQAVLDAQSVASTLFLTVKRFSIGSISPKIVGIRVFDTQESVIRMDVELRWAGDPLISITVGSFAYAPAVEVSEVRFSAVVRITLIDLMPRLPCFSAVSISFMKKPDVTFSLTVASLDIMNMGPKEFNITSLVRSVIDSALKSVAIYPKQIIIPLSPQEPGKDQSKQALPTGVLFITFERGIKLKTGLNLMGCNPYVIAKSLDQTFRSKPSYGTRHPKWDESFEVMVYDLATQVIEVSVWDADPGFDTCLGKCIVGLKKVTPNERHQKTLPLSEVNTGSVVVSYEYIPMRRGADDSDEDDSDSDDNDTDDEDVLFTFTPEELNNDILDMDDEEIERNEMRRMRRRLKNKGRGGEGSEYDDSPEINRLRSRRDSHVRVSRRFNNDISVGIMTVSNIHLRNLKVPQMVFNSFKPFVELSLLDRSKKTKPQPGTTLPHFPETFSFIVKDIESQSLVVRVKNYKSITVRGDSLLGETTIPLADVMEDGDNTVEQEYLMNGPTSEFFVGLRITISCA